MHKGICIGGPMAGQTIHTRSDVGFVAIDAAGFAAWIYRIRFSDGAYVIDASEDPSLLAGDGTRALDLGRVEQAGPDKGLDVIALPGEDNEQPAAAPMFDDESDAEDGDF